MLAENTGFTETIVWPAGSFNFPQQDDRMSAPFMMHGSSLVSWALLRPSCSLLQYWEYPLSPFPTQLLPQVSPLFYLNGLVPNLCGSNNRSFVCTFRSLHCAAIECGLLLLVQCVRCRLSLCSFLLPPCPNAGVDQSYGDAYFPFCIFILILVMVLITTNILFLP